MLVQVHALAFDHVEVGMERLGEMLNRVEHHQIQSIAHDPGKEVPGALLPTIEPGGKLCHGPILGLRAIHQLIGAATPDVNRPNGPPLSRGHQQRAQVEGFRPFGSFRPAGLIGLLQAGERGGSRRHVGEQGRGKRRIQTVAMAGAADASAASLPSIAAAHCLPLNTAPSMEAR